MGKHERQAYLKAIRFRYWRAGKKAKVTILDEFCAEATLRTIEKYLIEFSHSLTTKPPLHYPICPLEYLVKRHFTVECRH
jgi:hypothetical protein